MSTAVHLLEKGPPDLRVVILDKHPVGCGGASSVAGGYVEPFVDICLLSIPAKTCCAILLAILGSLPLVTVFGRCQ